MKQLLTKFFNIRKGEYTLALLMTFYYYLILLTYYFLKPARDSLFLVKLGSNQLPIVFILIAFIVAPITAIYSRAGRSLKLTSLINITTIILIASLFVLRWLVQLGSSWVYYTFYIWVSIYGILTTSQFWLFANAVFNPAQAKRLFVLITLGGIIGAFSGGEVTSLIIKNLGVDTENLLFFCVAFLVSCIFMVNIIWKIKQRAGEEVPVSAKREEKRKEGIAQIFGTIRRNRHLLLIVGIISMTMMVASFVDYQFKSVSINAFPEKEDLTSFLGKFYGRLSLISLILQLVFAYRFLRILGVGGVIMFLPVGLLIGSVAMVVFPGLVAGVLLRGGDGCIKYSLDKTGRELLFLPVPLEVKKRTKVFIDMFIDRWFRGIAGGLLLLFTMVLGFSLRQISIVVIILLGIWIFLALLIKKEYVNAFRMALEKREIDLSEIRININEAATMNTLKTALRGDNDRQVIYALDMLADVEGIDNTEDVKHLLKHKNNEIRMKTIRILQSGDDKTLINEIEKLVQDTDPEIRLAAMHYLCKRSEDNGKKVVQNFLEHSDEGIVSTAVLCIAQHGMPEIKHLLNEDIFQRLLALKGETGENCRIQLAQALSTLNKPEFRSYLMNLINDSSLTVARHAIQSLGLTKDRELVQVLIKKLADKNYRLEARNALVEYGNRVLGTLKDYLVDDSVDLIIRKNITVVLSKIPTQESVVVLTESLTKAPPSIKFYILRALSKLRTEYSELQFEQKRIDTAIVEETKSYYEILHILDVHEENKENRGALLLRKALEEKLDKNLEQIFRLLGLCYPPKDIHNTYHGIISNKERLRASAIEFLDNILSKEIKKYLLPILDQDSPQMVIQHGRKLFDYYIKTFGDALKHLAKGNDSWLRACAIFNIPEEKDEDLTFLAQEGLNDPDPVVRETAELILENKQK